MRHIFYVLKPASCLTPPSIDREVALVYDWLESIGLELLKYDGLVYGIRYNGKYVGMVDINGPIIHYSPSWDCDCLRVNLADHKCKEEILRWARKCSVTTCDKCRNRKAKV